MSLRTIDAHAAKRLVDEGAILADIREGDEYARESRAPGISRSRGSTRRISPPIVATP